MLFCTVNLFVHQRIIEHLVPEPQPCRHPAQGFEGKVKTIQYAKVKAGLQIDPLNM